MPEGVVREVGQADWRVIAPGRQMAGGAGIQAFRQEGAVVFREGQTVGGRGVCSLPCAAKQAESGQQEASRRSLLQGITERIHRLFLLPDYRGCQPISQASEAKATTILRRCGGFVRDRCYRGERECGCMVSI